MTVRGFNQSAVADFCGKSEKSRDKVGTVPTDCLYENLREVMIGLSELSVFRTVMAATVATSITSSLLSII